MYNCIYCGMSIEESGKYCPYCGEKTYKTAVSMTDVKTLEYSIEEYKSKGIIKKRYVFSDFEGKRISSFVPDFEGEVVASWLYMCDNIFMLVEKDKRYELQKTGRNKRSSKLVFSFDMLEESIGGRRGTYNLKACDDEEIKKSMLLLECSWNTAGIVCVYENGEVEITRFKEEISVSELYFNHAFTVYGDENSGRRNCYFCENGKIKEAGDFFDIKELRRRLIHIYQKKYMYQKPSVLDSVSFEWKSIELYMEKMEIEIFYQVDEYTEILRIEIGGGLPIQDVKVPVYEDSELSGSLIEMIGKCLSMYNIDTEVFGDTRTEMNDIFLFTKWDDKYIGAAGTKCYFKYAPEKQELFYILHPDSVNGSLNREKPTAKIRTLQDIINALNESAKQINYNDLLLTHGLDDVKNKIIQLYSSKLAPLADLIQNETRIGKLRKGDSSYFTFKYSLNNLQQHIIQFIGVIYQTDNGKMITWRDCEEIYNNQVQGLIFRISMGRRKKIIQYLFEDGNRRMFIADDQVSFKGRNIWYDEIKNTFKEIRRNQLPAIPEIPVSAMSKVMSTEKLNHAILKKTGFYFEQGWSWAVFTGRSETDLKYDRDGYKVDLDAECKRLMYRISDKVGVPVPWGENIRFLTLGSEGIFYVDTMGRIIFRSEDGRQKKIGNVSELCGMISVGDYLFVTSISGYRVIGERDTLGGLGLDTIYANQKRTTVYNYKENIRCAVYEDFSLPTNLWYERGNNTLMLVSNCVLYIVNADMEGICSLQEPFKRKKQAVCSGYDEIVKFFGGNQACLNAVIKNGIDVWLGNDIVVENGEIMKI